MCFICGDCIVFPWGLSINLVLWKNWMSDSSEVKGRFRLELHSQSQVCVSEPESLEPGAEGGSTGGGEQGEELG